VWLFADFELPSRFGSIWFLLNFWILSVKPLAPMNYVKIFEGWPLPDAPLELVQLWYKKISPDHDAQVEIKNPT